MTDPEVLHRDAIVIDMTCPLAKESRYLDWWREGGATAIAPTITGMTGDARSGFAMIGGWHRYVRERTDTMIVKRTEDIIHAKKENKLGLILHCQGTAIIEDELDLIDSYHAAGLRVVQLCYNRKNLVGDGASERTDAGLSHFGVQLIARLNTLGMIIDCAHTGERTSLDAVENSSAPVIISHANARGVHDNRRNISDILIRAIAESGGVIGTVGFPPFLVRQGQPPLDRFIDDIAYKADLVGIDHVGIGIDYYLGQYPVEDDEAALTRYKQLVRNGLWRPDEYPPPPYIYPEGIETPRTLSNLTGRLLERGFSRSDVEKVIGLNWMRVFADVWDV